ncbi:head GIN domain-containing protein [Hymenobacter norwichensis]|uniref:head GIN domain-containing protein n=1 Tax=Hymenobacter norwichensis TaxID=223903 RepID=UPI0003B70725|nr:head GIN domain-containing protein [Hymenobacter norwichensis]
MKSFALLSVLATTALVGLSACSSVAQQQRSVGSFQMVKASGAINLYVRQGPTTKVEVDADQDVLESVKTEVRGNTLTIYRDKNFSLTQMLRSKTVKVYITTPQLAGIEVSGASDVKGETPISADDFRINASGASDVTLTLNAKSLTTNASGASDVRLDGRVERQQVDISGSSDYRASDLRSRTASVQASGASDAYVYVDDELQAHSSGASDVHNKGRARVSR